jgi:hypothetical protein
MKRILYYLALCSILFSCEKDKEKIVYKERIYSWKYDSNMHHELSVIMNSYSNGNSLYLMGFYNYTKVVNDGVLPPEQLEYAVFDHSFNYPADRKFPISDKYYVLADMANNQLIISPNDGLGNISSRMYISMMELIPDFLGFELMHYTRGECISLTNSNFALIPFRRYENNGSKNPIPSFLLIRLKPVSYYASNPADTVYTKLIELPVDEPYYESVSSLTNYGSNFMLSCAGNTFIIDTTGVVTTVYDDEIQHFIPTEDKMFGIAWDYHGIKYVASGNDGFSWSEIDFIDEDFMYINYTSIYDSVIGFYKSQLFTIQPKSETISGRELDTDGLEGKQITSVSEYGDDMVYVTTMSGGYYRSKESFFDSINED